MKIGMLFVATMFGRAFAALPRTAVSYLGFLPAFFRLGISNARIAYALGLSKNVGRLTAKIGKKGIKSDIKLADKQKIIKFVIPLYKSLKSLIWRRKANCRK